MPTSSITKQFVISGEKQIQSFLDAWEASEKDPPIKVSTSVKYMTDPVEIREFAKRLEASIATR